MMSEWKREGNEWKGKGNGGKLGVVVERMNEEGQAKGK